MHGKALWDKNTLMKERTFRMVSWKNYDELAAAKKLECAAKVDLTKVMAGEEGAKRVAAYSVPMSGSLSYNFAAKQVNDEILSCLADFAKEAQLTEKYE